MIRGKKIKLIHVWMILAPLIVIISAILPEGESVYSYLGITSEESICHMRKTTGLSCGSCGLTSAFRSIVKGDLINATSRHALSIPLFVAFMFFGVLSFLDLTRISEFPQKWFGFYRQNWKQTGMFALIIVLTFLFVRMHGEIMAGYYNLGGFTLLLIEWKKMFSFVTFR